MVEFERRKSTMGKPVTPQAQAKAKAKAKASPATPADPNDLPVKCPHCGKGFTVLRVLAGGEAICPGCAKNIPVTGDSQKADAAPTARKTPAKAPARKGDSSLNKPTIEEKKSVKKPTPTKKPAVSLKKKESCPECGATLNEGDILCVQCGLDLKKGTVQDVHVGKKTKPIYPILSLIALIALSGGVYWHLQKGKSGTAAPSPAPAPAPAPEAATPPPVEPEPDAIVAEEIPAPAMEPVVEETIAAAPVAPEPEPEPIPEPEPVVEPQPETVVEAPPPEPPPAPAADVDKTRNLIAAKLATQFPSLQLGDQAELKTKAGKVYQGEVRAIGAGIVQLDQAGTIYEVNLSNLDRRSRARLDADYRDQLVDVLTEKYLERKAGTAE